MFSLNVVGFTREDDGDHKDSGIAVVITDSIGGKKKMEIGKKFAGQKFYDCMGKNQNVVITGDDGLGEFFVDDGSVAVWTPQNVCQYLYIEN